MTKVSSGKAKSGPPAHANRFAFTHNRCSKLTKKILAMPIDGVCDRCRAIIEWRKTYRKYKPLTVPKKCVQCERKAVLEAYHIICKSCSTDKKICAKCLESFSTPKDQDAVVDCESSDPNNSNLEDDSLKSENSLDDCDSDLESLTINDDVE